MTRAFALVQFEKSPVSNPSWKRMPPVGVVAEAELLKPELFAAASSARTW
jgi:hypothetical protein